MAGGRLGGQGSMIQRGIWIFVSCCIVVAIWNSFPHNPKGFVGELSHKSDQLKGVASDVVDWLDGFTGGQVSTPSKDSDQETRQSPKKAHHSRHEAR